MRHLRSDPHRRAAALLPLPLLLSGGLAAVAQGDRQEAYRKPPPEIRQVLDAPPTPLVSLSPRPDRMLLIDWIRYPSIAELARPRLGLAGLRIDPRTNGPHAPRSYVGLRLQAIPGGESRRVTLPAGARLGSPVWSPDGRRFAFTLTGAQGISLWIADAATGVARPVPGLRVNEVNGPGPRWLAGSQTLLCQAVPAERLAPPAAPRVPPGPNVQESTGRAAPVRTYQDLLGTPHDAALFDHYAAARLTLVDTTTLAFRPIGRPAVFAAAEPSPDGKYLLVERVHRPYSYLVGVSGFPRKTEVWDRSGKLVHVVGDRPSTEQVPIGGVPPGRRQATWVPAEPATLQWVEALDEGDPRKKVSHRDAVFLLPAPFRQSPLRLARTQHRFSGLDWVERGGVAFLREYDRDRLWRRTYLIDRKGAAEPRLVWDLSARDRYRNPGSPVERVLANGHRAVRRHGDWIYLEGSGASEQGDRPFLDRLHLGTLQTERLWRCPEGVYETVEALASDDGQALITRRESPTEPPNYYLRRLGAGSSRALTRFADPAPVLRKIRKRLVTYRRRDGVPLSFTLYLPPDYREGERLPTVAWAYPQEFGDVSTAGQVSGSPHRFTSIAGTSHLFFLLRGYAVLDNVAMPVVGDPETVNNSFLEQVIESAEAAIRTADEIGVTDPRRVGVGGHSYGAFMTANLLAHSDLFRAGIARSGAYNRTLTPFGFQSERRTLWEAPEIYRRLSPFMYAHRINEPLLLIHGEADTNPGTFPIQSERMYHAIQGHGGRARYVTLPYEGHGYAARESVEHTLWEMLTWFDRHVKGAGDPGGRTPEP